MKCQNCKGTGKIAGQVIERGEPEYCPEVCEKCNGTGQVKEQEDYLECPECGKELEEEWGLFQDFSDEYGDAHEGLMGYKCISCGVRFNCQGEEVN
jgi:hypothetical protein